jgi:hypothetical protein
MNLGIHQGHISDLDVPLLTWEGHLEQNFNN